jgi:hypothetical protein
MTVHQIRPPKKPKPPKPTRVEIDSTDATVTIRLERDAAIVTPFPTKS